MGRISGDTRLALAGIAVCVLLTGCAQIVPTSPPPVTPPPVINALTLGVARAAPLKEGRLSADDAAGALTSFVESCPRLLVRSDTSGLTRPEDWRPPCEAAATWRIDKARQFFSTWFDAVRVGTGAAHATGYFEPELAGSRQRRAHFATPVYRLPADLVREWPAETPPDQRSGPPPVARKLPDGTIVPYFSRAEIEAGALAGEALEIAWVADPVAAYFLQIQGSGRIRTPEGEIIRVGFAGKNGRPYRSIGALMQERGLIGSGPGQYPGSMQGISRFLREQQELGRELKDQNENWVFFREVTGDGPLGALEVPVRAESSVAADPAYVPLGAPVLLALDDARASGLWIAQDTGGAITGPNRFDTFWGAGDAAGDIAGGMSARGQASVLLPKGSLKRLGIR